MKINFKQKLKKIDGQPLKDQVGELTLFSMCQNAVLAPEEKQSGEDKVKAYKIAMKIEEKEVDLTTEEIAYIKEKVRKNIVQPLIVGQVDNLLEGK